MARLRYWPSAAEFVIGLSSTASMLDEAGEALDPPREGRIAVVPLTSDTFDVYLDSDLSQQTTDLRTLADEEITSVSSSSEFASLGRLDPFQGPDEHFGPLWLSADGVQAYRVEPDSDYLVQALQSLATGFAGLSTSSLTDWNNSGRQDGYFPRWSTSSGQVVYGPAPEVGSAAWSEITGKPTTFPSHWDTTSGKPSTFPPAAHNHDSRYYTQQQVLDAIAQHAGGSLSSMPSVTRFETTPGTYPARGTNRTDLRITWVGTEQPPIAASGGPTDWEAEGVAMAGVDRFERIEEPT